ncbi:MAG: hypothetical protein ACREQB_12165 [Candidatus Binataceae bacterium]
MKTTFVHISVAMLAGWYLMVPPAVGPSYDASKPLSSWRVFSAHDHAYECEGAKFLNRAGLKDKPGDPMRAALDHAQCIATDDPRLKP